MCGIFGFVTTAEQPASIVLDGLRELEYRGYDSWGVATASGSGVTVAKDIGKLSDIPPNTVAGLQRSTSGLGHTRWATHGAVTQANAHPHLDCSGRYALIHNGIVENHNALRPSVATHGFASETDSEVVCHVIEDAVRESGSLLEALMSSFRDLQGLNAISVLDGVTGEIVAIKNGSPLIVGVGDDGHFLASDPVALIPHTNRLIFVEDGQAVRLTRDEVTVYNAATGVEILADVRTVDLSVADRNMGAYQHWMQKEIDEQPQVLRRIESSREQDVQQLAALIRQANNVYVTGCGTAHNAAMAAQYLFARIAHRRIIPVMASEMALYGSLITSGDLVIALSQSGETIDVLDAVRLARDAGAGIAALTNSEGSTLYRTAALPILLDCGTERCVLATKTYSAKLAILTMTAHTLAGTAEIGAAIVAEAANRMAAQIVDEEDHRVVARLAGRLAATGSIFVLGRGTSYPLALEAALKIKEVSYIHAEGFAAGELKHGVIALIESGTPVIVLATEPATVKPLLAAAAEVRARGALTIGLCPDGHEEFDIHIPLRAHGDAALFECAAVFQLLAYQLALALNRDPDKPRNLAKSVTVR